MVDTVTEAKPATASTGADERDDTVEIPRRPSVIEIPQPPLRASLVLGILSGALFVGSAVWLTGGSSDALGSAAAQARSVPAPVAANATPPSSPAASTAPRGSSAARVSLVEEPTVEPVAPSAARRECMAQIESAHLFRQLASQASDQSKYSRAASAQINRMTKARPVGPRTLSRIAERMWEQRSAPDRGAAWWSTQFSRCEQARMGGSWYVVRG